MTYLVVSGMCVEDKEKLRDSTSSELDKEDKRIRIYKSSIAHDADDIIRYEQELSGRVESSVIRYY